MALNALSHGTVCILTDGDRSDAMLASFDGDTLSDAGSLFEQCPVCFESVVLDPVKLDCHGQHVYHADCARLLVLKSNGRCCLCRDAICYEDLCVLRPLEPFAVSVEDALYRIEDAGVRRQLVAFFGEVVRNYVRSPKLNTATRAMVARARDEHLWDEDEYLDPAALLSSESLSGEHPAAADGSDADMTTTDSGAPSEQDDVRADPDYVPEHRYRSGAIHVAHSLLPVVETAGPGARSAGVGSGAAEPSGAAGTVRRMWQQQRG